MEGQLVVFDTETCGISFNYIISLAYLVYEKGKKVDKGMLLCNPDYPIDPGASAINGFTNENTKHYPLFKDQWPKVEKYFNDSVWMAHNASFDMRALRREFSRYRINEPDHSEIDTLKIARAVIPKGVTKNYKLGTLCDFFGIKLENFHNADVDTEGCAKVFMKLKEYDKTHGGKHAAMFEAVEVNEDRMVSFEDKLEEMAKPVETNEPVLN